MQQRAFLKGSIIFGGMVILLTSCQSTPTAQQEPLIAKATPLISVPHAVASPVEELAAPPTPVISATQTIASPLIVATEVTSDDGQWEVYRGPNLLPSDYWFEISYAPTIWTYANAEPSGPHLLHNQMESCRLVLHGFYWDFYEDVGAIDTVQLAGREWKVYMFSKDQPGPLSYYSEPFMFDVVFFFNPPAEVRELCRQAAEEVIDTFSP